jgi:hypothetical protein
MMMMIDITWWFNKSIGWWQKFIISNIDNVLCQVELLEFLKSLGHGHGIFEDIMITSIPIGLILWTCHKKYLLFQQSQPYVNEDFSN